MRTHAAHILPGCLYCNFDHDPAIECRFKPKGIEPMEPETSSQKTAAELCECGFVRGAHGLISSICPHREGFFVLASIKGLENGLQKPNELQYVAKHGAVLQGTARVATARSHAFAKRIAKALNRLQDGER